MDINNDADWQHVLDNPIRDTMRMFLLDFTLMGEIESYRETDDTVTLLPISDGSGFYVIDDSLPASLATLFDKDSLQKVYFDGAGRLALSQHGNTYDIQKTSERTYSIDMKNWKRKMHGQIPQRINQLEAVTIGRIPSEDPRRLLELIPAEIA